jgi:hypothetical protein
LYFFVHPQRRDAGPSYCRFFSAGRATVFSGDKFYILFGIGCERPLGAISPRAWRRTTEPESYLRPTCLRWACGSPGGSRGRSDEATGFGRNLFPIHGGERPVPDHLSQVPATDTNTATEWLANRAIFNGIPGELFSLGKTISPSEGRQRRKSTSRTTAYR